MNDSPASQRSEESLELDSEASAEIRQSDKRVVVRRAATRAREAWPNISVDIEPFVDRVQSLLDPSMPVNEALDPLAIDDLFLAYACSLKNVAALKAFAKECDEELRMIGGKLRISGGELDDIRQTLWNKLFLPIGDSPPAILKYGGKGRLRHWFRVLATRSVLDDIRRAKHSESLAFTRDSVLEEAATEIDSELANIRQHYRGAFRTGFESAVRALEPEERNLLKCHYIRGMSLDQLARTFGTHKSTVSRRVGKAREKLLELTRSHLKSNLGANSHELDSVMRLFDGEMSVSLSRLLK